MEINGYFDQRQVKYTHCEPLKLARFDAKCIEFVTCRDNCRNFSPTPRKWVQHVLLQVKSHFPVGKRSSGPQLTCLYQLVLLKWFIITVTYLGKAECKECRRLHIVEIVFCCSKEMIN